MLRPGGHEACEKAEETKTQSCSKAAQSAIEAQYQSCGHMAERVWSGSDSSGSGAAAAVGASRLHPSPRRFPSLPPTAVFLILSFYSLLHAPASSVL